MRTAAVLSVAVALAFSVRVIPSWHVVLTPAGVNFQDNDCWFHMRVVHNLVAHFPKQSTFDPYAAFPGGGVIYSDPWDFAVASAALILGAGKPGPELVDMVGVWLPPILGALFPLPVFFLGRRLFGELAAGLSAIAVAVIPGTLLWETHLGVPDHHVAEGLLAILALGTLCAAPECTGRSRLWMVAAAGILTGVYLGVRPAGVFVPACFAIAAVLEPVLAPLVMGVLCVGGVLFAVEGGAKWAQFTWLALAGSCVVCGMVWILSEVWRRKQWRQSLLLPGACTGALAALGMVAFVKPLVFWNLVTYSRHFLPGGSSVLSNTVAELAPLWKQPPGGLASVFEGLGGLWPFALVFLVYSAWNARRKRYPSLTLFVVWALVMTAGGFIQTRMVIYSAPIIALLAGAGAEWIVSRMQDGAGRFRIPAPVIPAAFVVFALATSLPAGVRLTGPNGGVDASWRSALTWLGQNTPEPMGDRNAWSKLWTKPLTGDFPYPKSAYGVLTWWPFGYQVSYVAHRMPNTDGTQVNADTVAKILLDTNPERARSAIGKLSTRYVVLDPTLLTRDWRNVLQWAAADEALYRRKLFAVGPDRRGVQLLVYLPDFYRSMAARLYVFDGRPSATRFEITVFATRRERATSGEEYDILVGERKFSSEQKAYDYMAANTGENLILGSADPTVSCVELEDLPWIRQVFTSDDAPMRKDRAPKAVKVFEVK